MTRQLYTFARWISFLLGLWILEQQIRQINVEQRRLREHHVHDASRSPSTPASACWPHNEPWMPGLPSDERLDTDWPADPWDGT